ncbi:hypothetical protein [Chryseobacterium luquanense]|uniref:DUF5723 domain-containing protein n=1 Tax=Chryseobacterium luquanense TaxID=2983766 RepID=A0ABT3XYC5_9FLAO|nr:hypothetical protein [Chryseobacterium luquanense]MCX8530866.1 hypothetical protein [Chryseobacterium luquanense]
MDNLIKQYQYNIIVIFILSIFPQFLLSQNIINGGGTSSIPLNPGFKETKKEDSENKSKIEEIPFNLGMIKFTTLEKKLELNYYSYFVSENFTDYFVGISGSGEIKNSVTNLFSTGNIVSGGDANIKVGFRLFKNNTDWMSLLAGKKTPEEIQEILDNKTKPASDLWLIASGGFTGSSFKHFQADSIFSKQVEKINFTGVDMNIGFNYWNARILNNTILAGATIGIKQSNNFEDLIESSQEDTRTITDSDTGTTRKVVIKQTVYNGFYKESTVYPLNLDLYFVPQNLQNLAFLGYSRTDISKFLKPKTKFGFGIFFLKNQNAFNPIAGLTLDYADVFNVDPSDDDKSNLSKFKIGITTRINIVNSRSRK